MNMTCSECWATVATGLVKCPRCGAKMTGARPSVLGLLKAYPWLIVLLALSVMVTLWAATRRAPVPEPIPPAVEPVAEAPAPQTEPEPAAPLFAFPVSEPAPAPASPAEPTPSVPPAQATGPEAPSSGAQRPDGTWEAGPGGPKPGGF